MGSSIPMEQDQKYDVALQIATILKDYCYTKPEEGSVFKMVAAILDIRRQMLTKEDGVNTP